MLKEQVRAKDTTRTELTHRLGLDRSLPDTYVRYAAGVLHGDLGRSVWSRKPVTDLIASPLGITLELAGMALLFAVLVGVPIGVISAVWQGSPVDYLLRSLSILG